MTIMGYSISAIDYFEGFSTRFVGFFAYANLVPLFSIISIPFVVEYFEKKRIVSLGIVVMNLICSYYANSRSGQVIMLLILALFIYDYLKLKITNKDRKYYVMMALLIVFVFVILAFPYISNKITDLFISRGASNSMRFTLYEESMKMMLENNPIFGMGIKDLYGGDIYPYGSHSSYIGYFYKTGIVGGMLFLFSVITYIYRAFRWKKKSLQEFIYFISVIGLFVWMILEDLDGANWGICYAYIMLGIVTNKIRNRSLSRVF